MRSTHLFNYNWLYMPQEVDTTHPDSDFETVVIPHNNIDLPWHNFDDKEYQFISTYRKRFTLPEALNGRRVYLDFEGVMQAATVTINGHTFEEHKGGFVPFSYDITDYLNEEGENLLQVRVDSHERKDIPPHGGTVDYLVFGGIYRDVYLRYVNPVHITNVRVKTFDVLTDNPRVEVDVWVKNQSSETQKFAVYASTEYAEYGVDDAHIIAQLKPNTNELYTVSYDVTEYILWGLSGNTYLNGIYEAIAMLFEVDDDEEMLNDESHMIDAMSVSFGFREAVFKDDGFYLNGEKVFLRGLNRHQMYPFVGMAVGQRLQARDADIIKAMGCNIVRCSHYPQSKYF
ncbi:MAG: sugar-binding domain-containing protein, partial [Chloroflexota bacterium]